MRDPYLKRSQPGVHYLYGLRAACHWWLLCSCCDKQEVRYRTCFNLSYLHHGCQCCILAVAQHCPSPIARGHQLLGINAYDIWPQASMYVTNTLLLCSPASARLTQARPNYSRLSPTFPYCKRQKLSWAGSGNVATINEFYSYIGITWATHH